MIIHISGFPGSGKTTLGNKLQQIFGKKVIVYDTDEFIQHHNDNGKKLLKLEKDIYSGKKKMKEYNILWKQIMKREMNTSLDLMMLMTE